MHKSKPILVAILIIVILWGSQPATSASIQTWNPPFRRLATDPASLAPSLDLVGHLGGPALVSAVQDDYAYLAYNYEFAVVDISNPAKPSRVGYTVYPYPVYVVNAIVVQDGYAYLAATNGGLLVLDVTDPAHPTLKQQYFYNSECGAGDMDVDGNRLVLNTCASTITISDITIPGQLVVLGSTDLLFHPYDIAVSGGMAYLVDNDRLVVMDISDPANPEEVASLAGVAYYDAYIAVDGNYAVLAEHTFSDNLGLHVIDITDPSQPTEVGYTEISQSSPSSLAFAGSMAFTTNWDYTGFDLLIFDLSDPTHPTLASSINIPGYAKSTFLKVDASLAFVSAFEGGLQVMDVKDLQHPVILGAYQPPMWGSSLEAAGSKVFMVGDSSKLRAIDVSDPAIPEIVGYFQLPSEGLDLTLAGDYAYVVALEVGLRIINITNPALMDEVGSFPGDYSKIVKGGNTVYLVKEWPYHDPYSVDVLDVSNPRLPKKVGSFLLPQMDYTWVSDMVLSGDYLYLSVGGDRLIIVNVAQPQHPVETAVFSPGSVGHIALAGQYIYLADDDAHGLRVVDISDPGDPFQVGFYAYPPDAIVLSALAAKNGMIYAAFDASWGSMGVWALDGSNPNRLVQISHFYPGTNVWSIDSEGADVFVGDWTGLTILRPSLVLKGQVADASHIQVLGIPIAISTGISTTTDASGSYAFGGLLPGAYTITPSHPGYSFWPPVRQIILPSNQAVSQSFTILPEPVSIMLTPWITTTLTYTDLQTSLTKFIFPMNSITETATVTITPTLAAGGMGWWFTGHAFELSLSPGGSPGEDLLFQVPISVTIAYTDWDIRAVAGEDSLALYWWNGSGWEDAFTTCPTPTAYVRNETENILQLPICRTGFYALFGQTNQFFLPTFFRLAGY